MLRCNKLRQRLHCYNSFLFKNVHILTSNNCSLKVYMCRLTMAEPKYRSPLFVNEK